VSEVCDDRRLLNSLPQWEGVLPFNELTALSVFQRLREQESSGPPGGAIPLPGGVRMKFATQLAAELSGRCCSPHDAAFFASDGCFQANKHKYSASGPSEGSTGADY